MKQLHQLLSSVGR